MGARAGRWIGSMLAAWSLVAAGPATAAVAGAFLDHLVVTAVPLTPSSTFEWGLGAGEADASGSMLRLFTAADSAQNPRSAPLWQYADGAVLWSVSASPAAYAVASAAASRITGYALVGPAPAPTPSNYVARGESGLNAALHWNGPIALTVSADYGVFADAQGSGVALAGVEAVLLVPGSTGMILGEEVGALDGSAPAESFGSIVRHYVLDGTGDGMFWTRARTWASTDATLVPVPEPSTLVLWLAALAAVPVFRRRR